MNGDLLTAATEQSYLSEWLSSISCISEECKLDISDDGFHAAVVDPANVAYTETTFSPVGFDTFDYSGDDDRSVYGCSLSKLQNAIGVAGSADSVRIKMDDEHSMRVEVGGVGFDHAGINPDTIRQRPQFPDIDFTAVLSNVPVGDLKRGAKACDMVSENTEFVVDADEETVEMHAEGDTDDAELQLHTGDTDLSADDNVSAGFSLEYLKDMTKGLPSDGTVDLHLKTDFPVQLGYDHPDFAARGTMFLAPRIDSE